MAQIITQNPRAFCKEENKFQGIIISLYKGEREIYFAPKEESFGSPTPTPGGDRLGKEKSRTILNFL